MSHYDAQYEELDNQEIVMNKLKEFINDELQLEFKYMNLYVSDIVNGFVVSFEIETDTTLHSFHFNEQPEKFQLTRSFLNSTLYYSSKPL
jgi:hypothetical protein